MDNLTVCFHLKKADRMIYIEDTISDEIMNTARNFYQVKALYCKEKGYDPKQMIGFSDASEPDPDIFS